MLQIITDSSAEISKEEAERLGVRIVPLTVVFGGEAYQEGVDLDKEEFYRRLTSGEYPHSAMPSSEQFAEAFRASNGEETLVILISSALSGTVEVARLAKREGGFDNVHVYDSLCTTAMMRLLVEAACANREKGMQAVITLLDELRPRIALSACLDTLEFLYKGGRIKKGVAIVGELLGIKPIIGITPQGTVELQGKTHGQKRALRALAEGFSRDVIDEEYPVYFLQTDRAEPAEELMRQCKREGARKFRICCAVGTHIGPNAAGLVYVVKRKA